MVTDPKERKATTPRTAPIKQQKTKCAITEPLLLYYLFIEIVIDPKERKARTPRTATIKQQKITKRNSGTIAFIVSFSLEW